MSSHWSSRVHQPSLIELAKAQQFGPLVDPCFAPFAEPEPEDPPKTANVQACRTKSRSGFRPRGGKDCAAIRPRGESRRKF